MDSMLVRRRGVETGRRCQGMDFLLAAARGDQRDGEAAGKRLVNGRAENDVRVFTMAVERFHQFVNFTHHQSGRRRC
jgi:hypothetical protein